MSFADDLSAADMGDHVINHIFGCGLTLVGLVGRPDVTDEVARRLQDVIDELDMAVSAIRRAAFTARVADRDQLGHASAWAVAVVADPRPGADVRIASDGERRRLSRFVATRSRMRSTATTSTA